MSDNKRYLGFKMQGNMMWKNVQNDVITKSDGSKNNVFEKTMVIIKMTMMEDQRMNVDEQSYCIIRGGF